MNNEKQRVALVSMLASGLMAIGKFTFGIITGSIGLISEGIHSSSDFIATVITWWAVRVSDKPADDDHHFGHGKMESMAALFQVLLLVAAALWIAHEAIKRLLGDSHEIVAAPIAIAILVISIVVDYFRVKALRRVARSTGSPALEADALHFFSDMLSSSVVLIGMIFVTYGFLKADAIAAIIVAGFILFAAIKLGKESFDALVDAAPAGSESLIKAELAKFPDVIDVERIRVRSAGPTQFAEITLAVPRTLPLERVAELKQQIVTDLQQAMGNAEVVIIARGRSSLSESVATQVRVIAANLDAAIHRLTIQQLENRLSISMDLEVSGELTVEEAHQIASGLEVAIREKFGQQTEIDTHIEPLVGDWVNSLEVTGEAYLQILQALLASAQQNGVVQEVHNVRARITDIGFIVNFHCRLPPTMSVAESHAAVDDVERQLRTRMPTVARVVGHAEPLRSQK